MRVGDLLITWKCDGNQIVIAYENQSTTQTVVGVSRGTSNTLSGGNTTQTLSSVLQFDPQSGSSGTLKGIATYDVEFDMGDRSVRLHLTGLARPADGTCRVAAHGTVQPR